MITAEPYDYGMSVSAQQVRRRAIYVMTFDGRRNRPALAALAR
jgi:hypothetical protein